MHEPFVLHGDIEALVVDILTNHTPELVDFAPVTVTTDLRGYDAGLRWVEVAQEGAFSRQYNIIYMPKIGLDVRADRRDVAKDIIEISMSSIFRAVGHSAWGETLSRVRMELGPLYIPDFFEDTSYRYICGLRLTTLADPGSGS